MREIKFRAWDNTEKKMLSTSESWNKIWWDSDAKEGEDDYNYHSKQLFIDNQGHVLELTDEHGVCDMHYLLRGKPKYDLMQYTGLKDKNGKEIYEGDIVRYQLNNAGIESNKTFAVSSVIFTRGAFTTKDKHNIWGLGYQCSDDGQLGQVKVIGNIYENPELIKNNGGV